MTVEARDPYSSSTGPMVLAREPRSERMLIEREPNATSGGELMPLMGALAEESLQA
jgi:hypothetical protein